MKKVLTVLLLLVLFSSIAQKRRPGNLLDRFYIAPGVGFNLTTEDFLSISASPQVGYKITDAYSAGIGIIYQYVRFNDLTFNNYGWSVFNRLNVTDQFFLYGEFERLNYEFNLPPSLETDRANYNSIFFGIGYSEYLGGNASFNVALLYNVLYDTEDEIAPYNSPLVPRFWFGFNIL